MRDAIVKRLFIPEDVTKVAALQRGAPEFSSHYPKHDEWLKKASVEIVRGERFAFGVFTTEFDAQQKPKTELVGSIILRSEAYSSCIEIKNLFMHPDRRRKGLGKMLYKAVEHFCRKRGCDEVQTEVPVDEIKTVNFLNACGFRVINLLNSPYKKGDLLYKMSKPLPPFYTGDPFDLYEITRWLLSRVYGFNITGERDFSVFFQAAPEARFSELDAGGNDLLSIAGRARVSDSAAISERDIRALADNPSEQILFFVTEEGTKEQIKAAEKAKVRLLSRSQINRAFGHSFTYPPPKFPRTSIGGLIVRVSESYFLKYAKRQGTTVHFKGSPLGKYLKPKDRLFFFVEGTGDGQQSTLRAVAEVSNVSEGTPDTLWTKYRSDTVFPEGDFRIWSKNKHSLIAIEFSKLRPTKELSLSELFPDKLGPDFPVAEFENTYLSLDQCRAICDSLTFIESSSYDRSGAPLVFVSSTIDDLAAERDALADFINKNYSFNVFKSENAGSFLLPHATISEKIQSADCYICIFGERYGYEFESPFGRRISATHDEFLQAKKCNVPILAYAKNVPVRDAKLSEFMKEVGDYLGGVKYQYFSTKSELIEYVRGDLSRRFKKPQS